MDLPSTCPRVRVDENLVSRAALLETSEDGIIETDHVLARGFDLRGMGLRISSQGVSELFRDPVFGSLQS